MHCLIKAYGVHNAQPLHSARVLFAIFFCVFYCRSFSLLCVIYSLVPRLLACSFECTEFVCRSCAADDMHSECCFCFSAPSIGISYLHLFLAHVLLICCKTKQQKCAHCLFSFNILYLIILLLLSY